MDVTVAMYMWEPGAAAIRLRPRALLVTALVVAAVGILQMGIFPGPLIDLARRSVGTVMGAAETALP